MLYSNLTSQIIFFLLNIASVCFAFIAKLPEINRAVNSQTEEGIAQNIKKHITAPTSLGSTQKGWTQCSTALLHSTVCFFELIISVIIRVWLVRYSCKVCWCLQAIRWLEQFSNLLFLYPMTTVAVTNSKYNNCMRKYAVLPRFLINVMFIHYVQRSRMCKQSLVKDCQQEETVCVEGTLLFNDQLAYTLSHPMWKPFIGWISI